MSYSILLVDGSRTARAFLKRTIELSKIPMGKLLEAADGTEGLDVLATEDVDLVLSDIHMPKMTGVEMVRELSKKDDEIKVEVTTSDSKDRRANLYRAAVDDGLVLLGFETKRQNLDEVFRDLTTGQEPEPSRRRRPRRKAKAEEEE